VLEGRCAGQRRTAAMADTATVLLGDLLSAEGEVFFYLLLETMQKRQDKNNKLLILDFRTGERKKGRDRRANI
jgi:hypothetical protein